MRGVEVPFWKSVELTFGVDWLWWLVPTAPLLKVNYYEKLWSEKAVAKGKTEKDEEWDLDKKHFAKLKGWVDNEKSLLFLVIIISTVLVLFYFKPFLH